MKLLKKINLPMGACALFTGIIFIVNPTMISGPCCGFCVGMFVADTICNWKHR